MNSDEEILKDMQELSQTGDSENDNKGDISGPIKFIGAFVLVVIIVFWAIPYSYVKDNPHPKYIPEIDEVYNPVDVNRTLGELKSRDEYRLYVNSRDPIVKGVADMVSSISCDYSENYRICQAKALFVFVRDKFDYVRDPSSYEYVKTPIESLNNLGGDCDDASVLLSSLLGSIGVRTRLVFVPSHVYVEAHIEEASSRYKAYKGEDWIALDPTCKNCEFGKVNIKYLKTQKAYLEVT